MNNVSAIIVAGGKGTRLSDTTKKQYIKLNNKEVLAHTIEVFERMPIIKEIIVVCPREDLDFVEDKICDKYKFKKVRVIEGGKERQHSVYNGIKSLSDDATHVVIHDGARPFLRQDDALRVTLKMLDNGASVLGIPMRETVKMCVGGEVIETLDRETIYSIQTPQCFEKELIKRAHKNARQNNILATDDSFLVEQLGEKVYIVEGSASNIKITTPEDLVVAEKLLENLDKKE